MSLLNREQKKSKTVKRYAKKRMALKNQMQQAMKAGDIDETMEIQLKLQKLPRNASPTRLTRRYGLSGRARGNYQKVGISKIKFREKAMNGEIPGLVKASW